MTTTAPRFAGLQKALAKISARTADEKQRMRAAANGEPFTGRLGTTKGRSAQPASYYAETDPVSCPDFHARAQGPKSQVVPASAAVDRSVQFGKSAAARTPSPAPVATKKPMARAEIVAQAVRNDPKLKGLEDVALHMLDDPELKGLSGDGVVRCLTGIDAGKYRASMAEEKRKASIAHADGVWSRARASLDGSGATGTAPAATVIPAMSGRKLSAADARADAVWDRARASIDGNRSTAAANPTPAAKAKSTSVDDIWARAYATVAR